MSKSLTTIKNKQLINGKYENNRFTHFSNKNFMTVSYIDDNNPTQKIKLQQNLNQSLMKNPEQQQLKMLVKKFIRQNDISKIRQKIDQQKQIKTIMKNNQRKIKESLFQKNKNYLQIIKQNSKQENQIKFPTRIVSQEIKHLDKIDNHHLNCQKCKNCKCKNHHCHVKVSLRDPVSKFFTNHKIADQQVRRKSIEYLNRPEIHASFYAQKLSNIPQYHQKFQNMNNSSSYQIQYLSSKNKNQQVQNQKYLKLSNIKFGLKQLKNFDSSYAKQYSLDKSISGSCNKGALPFIVKQPQNLNNFGLKYNSIQSSYEKQYKMKNNGRRSSLRPRDLLKDLNIFLIKDSQYKKCFSSRDTQQSFSLKNNKMKQQKKDAPIINRNLSSSFIPLEKVPVNISLLESSYKKAYNNTDNDLVQYSCPYGHYSSFGIATKFY